MGLPEGSGVGSQVQEVWLTAEPAATGVSCSCRLSPEESSRSTVETPALVLCSWIRSSGLSLAPRFTTVAWTGFPDNALMADATLAALLSAGAMV